jgi:hypothetical protein
MSKKPLLSSRSGHLRVVRAQANHEAYQLDLFPDMANVVLLVNMASIGRETFLQTIAGTHPRWVFDVRPVPNFDLGSFSRRAAFSLFGQCHSRYEDIGAIIGLKHTRDAALSSGAVGCVASRLLAEDHAARSGPVAFLLDGTTTLDFAAQILRETLQPRPSGGWKMKFIPEVHWPHLTQGPA